MKVVWSPDLRLHDPSAEIWVGVRIPGTEVAARVDAIVDAVAGAGHDLIDPRPIGPGELEAVHAPDLVGFLRDAWSMWGHSPYIEEPGQDRVVPYVFPLPGLTSGRPPRRPTSVAALAGMFAIDTMTLIGPGTWEAVEAAAACALTAADLVVAGAQTAYAVCRPPGHHAGRNFYGGSCYLNNAALAASRLGEALGGPVSVIDLDAHHGNGTQEIFYARDDVRYGSLHIDPAAGYFPHFLGYPDETGVDAGQGANLNITLPPGTSDEPWLEGVERLAEFAEGSTALVISLGVDAWRGDPESPLEVTHRGFDMAGRILASTGVPTVLVQEGGYDLEAMGSLVVSALEGFAEATRSRVSG